MRKGSSRDTESQILVTDLLRREGQPPKAAETERRTRPVLRVLGAAAGVALLCGTVALGITYFNYDGGKTTPAAAQQHLSGIVGGKAVSPNAINAQTGQQGGEQPGGGAEQPGGGQQGGDGQQGGGSGNDGKQQPGTGNQGKQPGNGGQQGNPGGGGSNPGTGVPTTNPGAGQTSAPSTSSPRTSSSSPKPTSAAPTSSKSGGLLDPILDPILGFLSKAPEQPEAAYAMLGPELQSGSVEEFKADWAGVESATIADSRADGADAAIVTVDYRWKDGRTLRVEQRMTVQKLQRKITNAKVLSSQGR